MAWTVTTVNQNRSVVGVDTVTLPNATNANTEQLTFLSPDPRREKKFATFSVTYPASLAGNLTTELYGALTAGGTPVLLATIKSASSTAGTYGAVIDLNAYPALEYFVKFTAVGNESSRSASLAVFV